MSKQRIYLLTWSVTLLLLASTLLIVLCDRWLYGTAEMLGLVPEADLGHGIVVEDGWHRVYYLDVGIEKLRPEAYVFPATYFGKFSYCSIREELFLVDVRSSGIPKAALPGRRLGELVFDWGTVWIFENGGERKSFSRGYIPKFGLVVGFTDSRSLNAIKLIEPD